MTGLAFVLSEHPADSGFDTEDLEKIRARDGGEQRLGPAASADAQSSWTKDGHGFEYVVLLSPIEIVGRGDGECLYTRERHRGRHMKDGNDRLRIGEWEGP